MNFKMFPKIAERFISDNSPVILTGVGVIGTVATGWLAARGGAMAASRLDMDHDKPEGESKVPHDSTGANRRMAQAKLVWVDFVPAVSAGATTIAAIICANRISTARVAAMAAAYSLSENKLTEYKNKVTEKLGLEKSQEIQDEANVDKMNRTKGSELIVLGVDDVRIFDAYSGRFFKGTMESVRGAVNDTNFEVVHSNYASLEFFFDKLGLGATAYSDEMGFTADCPLEVRFNSMVDSDDRPALVIDYDVEPIRGWNPVHE